MAFPSQPAIRSGGGINYVCIYGRSKSWRRSAGQVKPTEMIVTAPDAKMPKNSAFYQYLASFTGKLYSINHSNHNLIDFSSRHLRDSTLEKKVVLNFTAFSFQIAIFSFFFAKQFLKKHFFSYCFECNLLIHF